MMTDQFEFLDPTSLAAMATPFRQKLLSALATPDSAAGLARQFDMSRQRIGYHMRELEKAGCIELAGERQQRGLTERLYQVRSLAYVVGPPVQSRSLSHHDRFSWAALLSLLAGAMLDLVRLRRAADAADKRLATLAVDARLRFASPAARRRFSEDLLTSVEAVIAKHNDPDCADGRDFRLVLGALPAMDEPSDSKEQNRSVSNEHTKH